MASMAYSASHPAAARTLRLEPGESHDWVEKSVENGWKMDGKWERSMDHIGIGSIFHMKLAKLAG